jgi:hypothetical protein
MRVALFALARPTYDVPLATQTAAEAAASLDAELLGDATLLMDAAAVVVLASLVASPNMTLLAKKMAPMSAAKTTTNVIVFAVMIPFPIVLATAVPVSAPTKFRIAAR